MSSLAHGWFARLVVGLAGALACASPPRAAPAPTREPREPAARPARPPEAPPVVALEPEILELLTAHRRSPPEPPPVIEARSPCHPDRPDAPREQSLCVCERACARPIDRASLARRLAERSRDPEAIARWLDAHEPSELHYPYFDSDGLRIRFDGDGKVTRCVHTVAHEPDAAVTVECAQLTPAHRDPAPHPGG